MFHGKQMENFTFMFGIKSCRYWWQGYGIAVA
jgi:hypothetical protein